MEMIVLLVMGVPVVLAIWLIVRSIQAGGRIEGLSRRLGRLELEVLVLREQKMAPVKNEPVNAPVAAPVPEPVRTTLPPLPAAQEIIPPPVVLEPAGAAELAEPVQPGPISVMTDKTHGRETLAGGAPDTKTESTPAAGSFEMRLGTYWLVRVGVVMLLTGLVFFGNFAYQNFIGKLGPGGKISLLYLVSAALMGAGVWWQRRAEKDSLRNYAQVLFAGGLAAVYFTTYAAHHIAQLCVVPSATLDGVLLLGWAGFMAWIADRRKSEVLAVFAVGLAYYTAAITNVGPFTLYSNLLLTVVGMFFLIRNRWVGLSFGSLVATYGSYAFWRFYHDGDWRWAAPGEGLWFGAGFLFCYWALFTAAAFLSKSEKLTGARRASFVTLNNGALFSLFLLTMVQLHTGGFWKFALVYGSVLLGLSALARRCLLAEPLLANTYLTQGLLMITMGLVAKFAGLHLALVLGFESVVLFMLGTLQSSRVQIFGSYVTGMLAVTWGGIGLYRCETDGVWSGGALGFFMLVNALWSHRQRNNSAGKLFRPEPGYFTLLALAAWFATTWFNTSAANFPLVLALEAVGLTFSIYLLGLPEITLLGQSFLIYAQAYWISHSLEFNGPGPWWQPVLILLVTLGLSHWWQHQKILALGTSLKAFWQGLYALALVAVIYLWVQPMVTAPVWLALTSLLALAVTGYGVWTRAWWFAAAGQLLLVASGAQFISQLWDGRPDWWFPLAPVAALGLLSYLTVRRLTGVADGESVVRAPLLLVAQMYRWVALVMTIAWVFAYIYERERIWVFMALGLCVFWFAGWRKNREALGFGAVLSTVGLALVWSPFSLNELVYLPNLLALLALLGQQQLARRLPGRYGLEAPAHTVSIILGSVSIWWFLSRAVINAGGGFYLTGSWGALALMLFVCGIILGERVYRWTGLGVLACALGRVVLFDVWKQETIYRVLTFVVLGVVLLAVGYIYNKYQDKISRWL